MRCGTFRIYVLGDRAPLHPPAAERAKRNDVSTALWPPPSPNSWADSLNVRASWSWPPPAEEDFHRQRAAASLGRRRPRAENEEMHECVFPQLCVRPTFFYTRSNKNCQPHKRFLTSQRPAGLYFLSGRGRGSCRDVILATSTPSKLHTFGKSNRVQSFFFPPILFRKHQVEDGALNTTVMLLQVNDPD